MDIKELFTKENCCRSMLDQSVESNRGFIAIINPEVLCEEHRTKDLQLVELLGGLGCKPHSFCDDCYVRLCSNRRKTHIKRTDLIGIADKETEKYAYKLMDPFTDEEKEVLNNGVAELFRMYDEIHQSFQDDSSKHLRDTFYSLAAKLAGNYYEYTSGDYFNLNIALMSSELVETKKVEIEKGLDPEMDPECIFLENLCSKIHNLIGESL